jgi:hypothetical protein
MATNKMSLLYSCLYSAVLPSIIIIIIIIIIINNNLLIYKALNTMNILLKALSLQIQIKCYKI